jgi:hypothetical protein
MMGNDPEAFTVLKDVDPDTQRYITVEELVEHVTAIVGEDCMNAARERVKKEINHMRYSDAMEVVNAKP